MRLYADENFPLPVVIALRELKHDVVTMMETGEANQELPDEDVLKRGTLESRILLTLNRRDFIQLHNQNNDHAGIVVCTVDPDFNRQASRIHDALSAYESVRGQLIRVNRPA